MTYLAIYFTIGLLIVIARVIYGQDVASLRTWVAVIIVNALIWPVFLAQLVYGLFKKTPYCGFCGYVGEDKADILEHIEYCEKHPAHQWAVDRDKYKEALTKIIKTSIDIDEDAEIAMLWIAKEALSK